MTRGHRGRFINYDVDGIAALRSQVRLPELERFRVATPVKPDIVVSVRPLVRGDRVPGREEGAYSYREWGGAVTANFDIEPGHPTRVVAAPLLALSRHVLYTNVIEPLLRFVVASRGRMLLHAGCVALYGQGVMLSAKTDTGKTATILRLLRDCGGTFLSDDMTIISEDGVAYRYPKPLTISAHTLRAVPHRRLNLGQRAALSVQSRLHSRSGRAAGKWLGERPLPIMAMNSLVQALIPPPKYMAERLVDCQLGRQQTIRHLFLIERGSPPAVEPVATADAVAQLLSNTADAYEFPPFSVMAPQLRVGGLDFDEVQRVEREVLRSAVAQISVVRMRVADFSWPQLVQTSLSEEPSSVGSGGELEGRVTVPPLTQPVGQPSLADRA